MKTEVIDNVAESRYELRLDGEPAAHADYVRDTRSITVTHTVTDPAKRGNGLAAILVRRLLDDARSAHQVVVPACWYVAQFIDDHPDYADLLATN